MNTVKVVGTDYTCTYVVCTRCCMEHCKLAHSALRRELMGVTSILATCLEKVKVFTSIIKYSHVSVLFVHSSADLYVVKHLDPYLRKSSGSQGLLLRIVSRDRRVHSIPEGSRKYCCYSSDGSSFEIPSASMVRQHRVVVTTLEMALHLTSMKLRGTFTHIFIDEAAQALECETIMPLTLAAEKTCVVLTGDHLQISPKVDC